MTIDEEVFAKMLYCRRFETMVATLLEEKYIKIPTYLSVGQEHVPAIISTLYPNSYVFPQHRCHSWYLCYGGKPLRLMKQLLGIVDADSNGMQGSASLSIPNVMFGHSGLLGDQIPIAVGFADAKQKHTICVAGDAAMEEDYALGALGYAGTKQCPILFIVEDNDLSILTKKVVRRSWSLVDVSDSLGVTSYNINTTDIQSMIDTFLYVVDMRKSKPNLVNISVERHLWHAGFGRDNKPTKDLVEDYLETGKYNQVVKDVNQEMVILWQHLQTLLSK
jgi:TPP-dependent pyruvate/acetoin dehydrogenase alpha subunit